MVMLHIKYPMYTFNKLCVYQCLRFLVSEMNFLLVYLLWAGLVIAYLGVNE